MRIFLSVSSLVVLCLTSSPYAVVAADPYVYSVVDVPLPGATETEVFGINNSGTLVGSYVDANGARQGFLLTGETVETITVPGATNTRAFGVNESGQITGRYRNDDLAPSVQHGFLRQPDGSVVDVDFPEQTFNFAWGINDSGQISGYYFEFPGDDVFITSFRREPDASFLPLLFSAVGEGNVFRGINNAGVHVGWSLPGESQSLIRGLLFDGANFTPFQIPGDWHTLPDDINNLGQIVGHAAPLDFSTTHGFFRDTDGTVTLIAPPRALEAEALGINDFGQIVGAFEDENEELHGFMATPIPVTATEQLLIATAATATPEPGKRQLLAALDGLLRRLHLGRHLWEEGSAQTQASAIAKFRSTTHQLHAYERLVKRLVRQDRISQETATELVASAERIARQLQNLLAVL